MHAFSEYYLQPNYVPPDIESKLIITSCITGRGNIISIVCLLWPIRLTYNLDPCLYRCEGQGRRSNVKVKNENHVFFSAFSHDMRSEVKVKVQGHTSRSPRLRSLPVSYATIKRSEVKVTR